MSEESAPAPDQQARELSALSKRIFGLVRQLQFTLSCIPSHTGIGRSTDDVLEDLLLITCLQDDLAKNASPLARDAWVALEKVKDHVSEAGEEVTPDSAILDIFRDDEDFMTHHYEAALSENEWTLRDIAAKMGVGALSGADGEDAATPDYAHSEGFRSVTWYGRKYSLTTNQSRVVELLWQAWKNGTPELSWGHIQGTLEIESEKMRDVFKDFQREQKTTGKPKNEHPWRSLIGRGAKDTYQMEENWTS